MKKTFWIFLDIDGVLNTSYEAGGYKFNSHCIEVLNDLYLYAHKIIDFNIVITSDWRTHFNLETLQRIFNENDSIMIPNYYTASSNLPSEMDNYSLEIERSFYIYDFIEQYGIVTSDIIILDDMDLSINNVFPMNKITKRFIHVPKKDKGINDASVIKQIYEFIDSFIMEL